MDAVAAGTDVQATRSSPLGDAIAPCGPVVSVEAADRAYDRLTDAAEPV